jgi:hypothetical protein
VKSETKTKRPALLGKKVRITLTYVLCVPEDFPTNVMTQRILDLVVHGVHIFVRGPDESFNVEPGARLRMTAVDRKKGL